MVIKSAALAVETPTQTTKIFYPETDGMPMPDGRYQSRHYLDLLVMLRLFFRLREDVEVGGDIFIYYVEGNPQLRFAPDCFVVIGVSMESFERNNTYLMWEVGKAPDFVLEIGSPSTWRNDLGSKRKLYASLGIGEYWMFDPSGGDHYGFALRGERLVDGEYRPLEMREDSDGGIWGHSPTLNLEFHWEDGSLRLYDPVGERWLRTAQEVEDARESAEAARVSAEAARVSAEAARVSAEAARVSAEAAREIAESQVEFAEVRAESAESRVAELEAELRRLRGESEL